MAQVVLGAVGGAIGGGVGQAIGAALGGLVDRSVIGALSPARQRGPRLDALRLQSTADGAPMAWVAGRARVTGQVIWAARFLEARRESAGGKGGPRTVDYDYSLSFAVAICEGPIDGLGRVWADGQPMNMTGVTMRLHRGGEGEAPDPLIEAVEGEGAAPAYRGTAYVVFEDLPLGPYGDRVPQLSFEVFSRPAGPGLEEKLEGVCLIPGAGEFVLAAEAVVRREGLTRIVAENVHHPQGEPDLVVSLDQLAAQAPNLKRVSLVIGWFGDDLRAGHCTIRPGVERRDKTTEPRVWSVAGLTRGTAHLISRTGGRPAYGGTPSDACVRQAVAALKARGWAVTLYPFVFMDIPADNDLPGLDDEASQPPHPWRGRMRGEDGAEAAAQVGQVFGGPGDWGLRRLALHYAELAVETGADGLIIGSEMRGLTWTRDQDGSYPAVDQYRTLAAECRAIVGGDVALTYAADWSEYAGHRPDDGSGDVVFHLDPLWADEAIDYVGIDWYAPLGDWRDGDGGIDAATWPAPSDPAYLAGQVAGGEGFDWFYADPVDRAQQVRMSIIDTAYGEDWVFRIKDLVGWWSNAHHDRPGGVRSAEPTAWTPGMKPIRLTEFGCAAVDRGGNAPNLFQDPKSDESALPPHSTGGRDDRMQRRAIEAVMAHFADGANNPVSQVYGGPMLAAMDAWCWDARPYPSFPALDDVWADAEAWRCGHWLNGRLTGDGADLLAAVLRHGGLEDEEFQIGATRGEVQGYVIDRPMRTRDALEPLLTAFDMTATERGGQVTLVGLEAPCLALVEDEGALADDGVWSRADRVLETTPGKARVRFLEEAAGYQTASVTVRGEGDGGGIDLDLPVVCGSEMAEAAAERLLAAAGGDTLTVALAPLDVLRLEAGDRVEVEGWEGQWRVERLALDESPGAVLAPVIDLAVSDRPPGWRPDPRPPAVGRPYLRLLDLPPLPGREGDDRPLAVVAADPWRPMKVWAGAGPDALTARGRIETPTRVGVLAAPLESGVLNRWDEINAVSIRVEGAAPASLTDLAVLGGANAVAVETVQGWEVMQFARAELIGDGVWRLNRLLRGQQGTDGEMHAGAVVGSVAVFLDPGLGRATIARAERGLPLTWRAGPDGGPAGGAGVAEIEATVRGLHDRPWSPAHLRVRDDGGDLKLSWVARARLSGEVWEGEPVADDPLRFQVRVLDGEVEVRRFIVEGLEAIYPATQIDTDFPLGRGAGASIRVAQAGAGFGWGVEAMASLAA